MKITRMVSKTGLALMTGFVFIFLFLVVPVQAATVSNLVTFDNISDLTNYFNPSSSPQFTNVSTGGINNTGVVNVPLGSDEIWTTKQGYSVSGAGDIYTFSAFFKIKANSGYGGLGFSKVDTNTTDYYGSPAKGIGMVFHGGGGFFANNRIYTTVSWPPDLVLGNWYKMIFEVTAKGSNTYDLKFQIWNSDSSGVLGTMKTEKTLAGVVNSDLGSASIIHGYFSAAGSRMEKIDNFLIELQGVTFVDPGLPVVLTASISAITNNSATSGGNVTDAQGAAVTAKGVCWSTSTSPTLTNNCTNDGSGLGTFVSSIASLASGTTYYVRAYATNSQGTSYGSENTFITEATSTPTPTSTSTPTPSPTSTPTPTQTNNSNNNSSSSTSSPLSCGDSAPITAPDLFQIDTNSTQATLYFAPAGNPVSYYFISYGFTSIAEGFSTQFNQGSSPTALSYTINALSPNTTYYFKVRGGNGCMPGNWSSVKSVTTKGGGILSNLFSEQNLIVSSTLKPSNTNSCSYIVQPGDSLWSIAADKLGDGSKYTLIKDLNKNIFSSDDLLSIGMKLNLSCDIQGKLSSNNTSVNKTTGYNLDVKVLDKGKPLIGALVTLHSKIQTSKTDTKGIAHFTNVEKGEHTVNLAYNGLNGQQKLTLTGDQKNQTLTVNVNMTGNTFSITSLIIIGILLVLIVFLYFKLSRKIQTNSFKKT